MSNIDTLLYTCVECGQVGPETECPDCYTTRAEREYPMTRELTYKERTTASLLSRLEELESRQPLLMTEQWEIDDIERELEERAEWEQKVTRW